MLLTRKKPSSILSITHRKYTNYNNGVQSDESCGYWGGMAPVLELGTTPGHRYSRQAVMMFVGSALQNLNFCGQTPWFLFALASFTVYTCVRLALFRRAASLTVFQHFLLTCTSPKSCLIATSVLNEFFKNGVKISLAIGCRYMTYNNQTILKGLLIIFF